MCLLLFFLAHVGQGQPICSLSEYTLSTHIVSSGDDRTVRVWRLMNDKSVQLEQVLTEHTTGVQYVRFIVTAGHAQIIVKACANDMCWSKFISSISNCDFVSYQLF
jgi:WD40 repeat protein